MATTREALLDAAYDAAAAGIWERTRMHDVAAAAGVSRQTLYNEFGSKDALAEALSMREATALLVGVEAAVEAADPQSPAEMTRAAVAFTLRMSTDNPLVKAALTDDNSGLLPFITTRAEPLLAVSRADMISMIINRWPSLPVDEVTLAAETVTRLVVSYLVLPSDQHDASAEAIADRVAHIVERLLNPSAPKG